MLCDICRYFPRDFNHTHRTACDCLRAVFANGCVRTVGRPRLLLPRNIVCIVVVVLTCGVLAMGSVFFRLAVLCKGLEYERDLTFLVGPGGPGRGLKEL